MMILADNGAIFKGPWPVPRGRVQLIHLWESTIRPALGKNASKIDVADWLGSNCRLCPDSAMVLADALAELLAGRNAE